MYDHLAPSDVPAPAWGQKPGQARPKKVGPSRALYLALGGFWPGQRFLKAKATGLSPGLCRYIRVHNFFFQNSMLILIYSYFNFFLIIFYVCVTCWCGYATFPGPSIVEFHPHLWQQQAAQRDDDETWANKQGRATTTTQDYSGNKITAAGGLETGSQALGASFILFFWLF